MSKDTQSKKIYIAGPMSGIPEFNFPAFFTAAAKFEAIGWEVFNPAARDIEKYGEGILNATGSQAESAAAVGFDLRDALGADLAFITQKADAIYMLPGWENSKGARAEHATAVALGLEIIYAAA